ncbi:energy-coupling factor transporter transmembrane component T family protein [Sphaerochaeta sp.]|uniref:energy-coupling factor transporter transmembrane component T family protein n=1 Tax=Sphaerochaeta sp. TaxID=1972642 RepID=UPI002FCA1C51
MAEALIFHYRHQNRFLNHCNPVTKFFSVILICLVLLSTSLSGAILFVTVTSLAALLQRLPIHSYKRELRFFIFLLILIFITEYIAAKDWGSALLAFLRFISIILCGLLIADSTAPDDLARSLGSLLDHIPFINGWMIASSIELTLSLLPMIFDAAEQVMSARSARLEKRRNPYTVITGLSTSIFSLLLDKAEDLSLALEARSFDPSRKRNRLDYTRTDFFLLCIVCILCVLGIVL